MQFNSNDSNNMLIRALEYLKMLMTFCGCISFASFIILPFITNLYIKGVYAGIAMLAIVIAVGTFLFIFSLIPKEDVDELYRMLNEELERRREELKKKKEELKSKNKDGEQNNNN